MTPEFLLSKVIMIRNGVENVTLGIEKIIDWWVLLCIYIKYKPWYDEISYNYGPYTSLRTWNCQLVGWGRKGIQLRRKNNQKTTLQGDKIFPRKRDKLYNHEIFPCLL